MALIVHLERGYGRGRQHTACGETFPTYGGETFATHLAPEIRHQTTQIERNVTCADCKATV